MYLSRNGGVEWEEVSQYLLPHTQVRKGRWIYEIGDHGSAIIAAPLGITSDTIMCGVLAINS